MAFGRLDDHDEPMAEMNVIPLVDVMLVLLVVFIVAAPVITHSVTLDLPKASSERQDEDPEAVTLSLDSQGQLYLDDKPVSQDRLKSVLIQARRDNDELVVYLRADESVPYRLVARAMASVKTAGIERLGFVSEPETP
ncbi:biopolymer transporter ExbD [Guyparkeria hydrothermalis]|uniref:ExbD/TolR family protein n=1 Tax=Guyparkeria TaxID=2035712 RepID=UPI0010AD65D5|nr:MULTISPECIES: biopolymer transporter ExbD [Guyparkeria]MCL7751862.1 biopolymer transporter ExbD [Guyparkeria hydrothermalis]TKA90008.1 biopolymer transporter ExbD [Guyparkeria sp. SB14A]